jgi:hypothetical protein
MPDRSRRLFLEPGAVAAFAVDAGTAATGASTIQAPFSPANPRIGLIGTGGRAILLLQNLLAADVQVPTLCDLVLDKVAYAKDMVANYMGIGYRSQNVPCDNPKWNERYLNGDMNTSLIKTANGLIVNLQHDVSNPHPYDRLNSIAGTKGVVKDTRLVQSFAGGNTPGKFPDFTRGRWKERKGCAI